ncbi:hypothetical protein AGLY_013407, partial [Aphis glycines]
KPLSHGGKTKREIEVGVSLSKIDNSNTASANGTATRHPKTSETITTQREKLPCIIKRVGHLINTLPTQDDSQKDCSATDISSPSSSSCNKHPIKNECENPLLKANINEMPIKNISETKVQPTQPKAQCSMNMGISKLKELEIKYLPIIHLKYIILNTLAYQNRKQLNQNVKSSATDLRIECETDKAIPAKTAA